MAGTSQIFTTFSDHTFLSLSGVKGEEEMFQLVPHLGLKGRPVVAKMTASGACRGQLGKSKIFVSN